MTMKQWLTVGSIVGAAVTAAVGAAYTGLPAGPAAKTSDAVEVHRDILRVLRRVCVNTAPDTASRSSCLDQ